ncbi:MAG: histone deacetylase [Thermosulfidibacteraceae bacterium]
MGKVGIFWHNSFARRSYLTGGNRLSDFPDAVGEILKRKDVTLYTCKRVDKDLVLKIHSEEMVREVESFPLCTTAYESAGGVVEATTRILKGDIDRAFCFIGCGGHHAGRNHFWGACCFNDVILAIVNAKETIDKDLRFVILDTDAHHGDGTRDLLMWMNERDVLHLCLCDREWHSHNNLWYDFDATWVSYEWDPNKAYIRLVENALDIAIKFKADFFFWYMGFDICKGDYGSLGIDKETIVEIASIIRELTRSYFDDKLQIVLAGGSMRELATWIIPRVIGTILDGEGGSVDSREESDT